MKILREDCGFYTGYSLAARSLRFTDQVRSQIISTFKRYNALTSMRPVMSGGAYLCVIISTIMQSNLDSYEKITTCKSCSYGDPKFSHPQLHLQPYIFTPRSPSRKGFASDYHRKYYTQALFRLLPFQTRILIHARGLSIGTTPMLLT